MAELISDATTVDFGDGSEPPSFQVLLKRALGNPQSFEICKK